MSTLGKQLSSYFVVLAGIEDPRRQLNRSFRCQASIAYKSEAILTVRGSCLSWHGRYHRKTQITECKFVDHQRFGSGSLGSNFGKLIWLQTKNWDSEACLRRGTFQHVVHTAKGQSSRICLALGMPCWPRLAWRRAIQADNVAPSISERSIHSRHRRLRFSAIALT